MQGLGAPATVTEAGHGHGAMPSSGKACWTLVFLKKDVAKGGLGRAMVQRPGSARQVGTGLRVTAQRGGNGHGTRSRK